MKLQGQICFVRHKIMVGILSMFNSEISQLCELSWFQFLVIKGRFDAGRTSRLIGSLGNWLVGWLSDGLID
jgi:hypothetical protein